MTKPSPKNQRCLREEWSSGKLNLFNMSLATAGSSFWHKTHASIAGRWCERLLKVLVGGWKTRTLPTRVSVADWWAQADPIRQHHRPVVEPHRIDIVAVSAGLPLDRPWLARHGAQQIVGPIGNHEDYAIWRCWWSRKIEPESMEMSHIWDVECGQSDHGT